MGYISAAGNNGSIQVHNGHVLIIKPGRGLHRIEIADIKRVDYEPAEDGEKRGWIKVVTDELQLPITSIKNALVDGNTIVLSVQSNDDFSRVQTHLYELLTKRFNR